MKKLLRVISRVILGILILIMIVFIKAYFTPAVPNNYTSKTETGGEIERKYISMGNYNVNYLEIKTDESFKKYEIYYPGELKNSTDQYPLVLFVNGTGIKGSKYKALFRHLASWGFIVAGNEEESSGNGISTEKTLDYLLNENNDPDSLFYQKIDIDNIGLSGHSQGGAGVLSSVTVNKQKEIYKTAVALSPANEELARGLGWNYKPEDVHIPILLLSGTRGTLK